jgi:hypothetical protein
MINDSSSDESSIGNNDDVEAVATAANVLMSMKSNRFLR